MKQVVLYGANDCHLCEVAREKVQRVRRVMPFEFRYEDVRRDPQLETRYGTLIPVVTVDGKETLVTKVTEFRLLKALALG